MCKDFKKNLGENIRNIRKSKKMTQENLSLESGISRSHIAMIEAGKRDVTVSAVFKISRALKVTVFELFSFDNLNEYTFDIEKLYE